MREKGQAAMEFLMTYGWAILVVLIAIGALAYFGVLNPDRFLPNSCTISPGIGCDEFVVDASGNGNGGVSGEHVVLILRNGLGEDITAVTVTVVGDDGGACATNTVGIPESGNTFINDGDDETYEFSCTTAPTAGTRFKSDITVAYTAGTLPKTTSGQIVSEVQA